MANLSIEAATAADLIRQARNHAGMSQTKLAELVGTTQSAISRWEKGHDEPRLGSLARVLRACGLRLELGVKPDDVDRAQIRQQLAMTVEQRLASVVNLSQVLATTRVAS